MYKRQIYNILEYGIGTGSIGGKVVDHYKQGEMAGRIVLKLSIIHI